MNKQSITFKADEQGLTKTGGINSYASNIVAYIEATFELGENWTGYDSVRAVWSNDYLTDISTVLDPNGRCIVPTEVLTDTGNVTVNLVGSISVDDELTDRLTTYPCKALTVDEDAKVEGDETESITPSQFEQFVSIVHDEVEEVTGMSAEASTLPAGSDATASYSDGVLSLGIPQGIRGEQGEQGETGHTGEPAGFGNVTASVDNTVGTPSVNVTASGPDTAKEFDFEFHNLKGDKGDTGETGATGNGIASTVLNPDYTLTITFTDGTSYTTPSIRGAKGDTGDTGATGNGIQSTVLNADYTLTITFTDGTSYTTPSIRGEQGPAGPVSDVTVNGTSVVDQNGIAKILMPELVKTVNGNPIVLDDAFGEVKKLGVELLPIQDLHGYSKPWAGGAGKNLIPNTYTSKTTVGITYTVGSDGTVTANGTATSRADLDISVPLKAGTYIANGVTGGGIATTFWAVIYKGGTVFANINNGDSPVITIAEDSTIIYGIRIASGYTASNVVIKPMIRLSSVSDNTFAPYSNICPITGHDSVTVGVTGKNLGVLSADNYKTAQSQRCSITYVDGGFDFTVEGTYSRAKYEFKTQVGQTYTLSLRGYSDANYRRVEVGTSLVWGTVDYGQFTLTGTDAPYTLTFTATSTVLYVGFYISASGTTGTATVRQFQIELGNTATTYEPYHGQSKTVTLPHTVYGAGVGVTSGSGKETYGIIDLGTLNWGYNSNYGVFYSAGIDTLVKSAGKCVCDSYESVANGDVATDGGIQIGRAGWFNQDVIVKDTRYSDTTAFKQAVNGVMLCYELATPTDLQTTPTDITLYNGDNVISSDGDMELTYVQDMAIVIEKLENLL